MNWFRNAFHYDQNKFKQEFAELTLNQLPDTLSQLERFTVDYKLYYKNTNCDPSNIIALIEKVALDAFKKAGVIIDDNTKYHTSSSWTCVGQDKLDPRVEITISPYKE